MLSPCQLPTVVHYHRLDKAVLWTFTIMTGIPVPYCPGVIENLASLVYGTPTQNTLAILELPSKIRWGILAPCFAPLAWGIRHPMTVEAKIYCRTNIFSDCIDFKGLNTVATAPDHQNKKTCMLAWRDNYDEVQDYLANGTYPIFHSLTFYPQFTCSCTSTAMSFFVS